MSSPAHSALPLGIGAFAAALCAAVLALGVASPARAAGITSVTPNPASPNAVITVVADCDGTVAESATVRYGHHRSDGSEVNFHINFFPFTGDQSISDSYDTTGISSPGILDGDYYLVTVTCDNPDTTGDPEFVSAQIPIILGGADPVDPPDESSGNDGVSFRTGAESPWPSTLAALQPGLAAVLVLALSGAVLLARERSRRRLSGR